MRKISLNAFCPCWSNLTIPSVENTKYVLFNWGLKKELGKSFNLNFLPFMAKRSSFLTCIWYPRCTLNPSLIGKPMWKFKFKYIFECIYSMYTNLNSTNHVCLKVVLSKTQYHQPIRKKFVSQHLTVHWFHFEWQYTLNKWGGKKLELCHWKSHQVYSTKLTFVTASLQHL